MYDLNRASGNPKRHLTRDLVTEKVSAQQIFEAYLGDEVRLNIAISSPFRKDENPSFVIFQGRNEILFKDHTTGESGDCFKFIQILFGCSFYDALYKVYKDLNLNIPDIVERQLNNIVQRPIPKRRELISDPSNYEITVKTQEFTEADKKYWSQYGITPAILKYYNIFSLDYVYSGSNLTAKYYDKNPIYGYLFFKDGVYTWKIYRPLAPDKSKKWRGSINRTVLQGWDQLPETGDLLILTKSLKDIMVLRTLGYYALSLQTETSMIKDTVMAELKERFKTMIVLNDFDLAGVRGTNKLRKAYDLKYFFVQDFKTRHNGAKDISDYRSMFGFENTKVFVDVRIDNLLNN